MGVKVFFLCDFLYFQVVFLVGLRIFYQNVIYTSNLIELNNLRSESCTGVYICILAMVAEKWSPDTFRVIISFGIENSLSLRNKMYVEAACLPLSSEKKSISQIFFRQNKVISCLVWCPLLIGIVIKQKYEYVLSSDFLILKCAIKHILWTSLAFLFSEHQMDMDHTVCYETFTPPTQDLCRQILLHNFP